MINYVSNLPANLRTGGFSAMNAAALDGLKKRWPVHYAGPINPPVEPWRKAVSKLYRMAGIGRDFHFFSCARLKTIAARVATRRHSGSVAEVFHGFTPWIATQPTRPYVAFSDCTFRDYIDIYHRRTDFRAADLARIEAQEAAWMRGAAGLGFTSAWAASRAVADYGLDPRRVTLLGIFGEIELPETDIYAGGHNFAFVSTNFESKGGWVVLAAFRRLRGRRPEASLTIVGDMPAALTSEPGVTVAGFLQKEKPDQNARLRAILATSRAIVHPTRSDISPLLAVEAGYFGCPVISSRRFAIPEIVEDGVSGRLLDDPTDIAAVDQAMEWMLEAQAPYAAMRRAAWTYTRQMHTRARYENRLVALLESAL